MIVTYCKKLLGVWLELWACITNCFMLLTLYSNVWSRLSTFTFIVNYFPWNVCAWTIGNVIYVLADPKCLFAKCLCIVLGAFRFFTASNQNNMFMCQTSKFFDSVKIIIEHRREIWYSLFYLAFGECMHDLGIKYLKCN